MKKTALFFLCAALVLTSVSCSLRAGTEEADASSQPAAGETTEAEPENGTQPTDEITGEEPSAPAVEPEESLASLPDNVEAEAINVLELSEPAQYKDGRLVMYFTNTAVFYRPDDVCSIGLISSDMADSISAVLDVETYPDIKNGDLYRGAVLVPSEPIPAGAYTFSVAIANYLVTFDMTVD